MKIKLNNQFFYRVLDGETVTSICKKFNTSKANILRNNPKLDFYAGEWIKIKTENFKTHIVKPTETLLQIAEFYNIPKEQLKKDNNLTEEKLFIGQTLKIFNQN